MQKCKNMELIMERLSIYLNNYSDYITKEMVENLAQSCGLDIEESYRILLAAALSFDITYKDKELYNDYFKKMICKLDINKYVNNPYYKNIKINNINTLNWSFKLLKYKPYEAFVYNDFIEDNGKIIPQIGFFTQEYVYPCIMENNREWMLITPNEIETMQSVIDESKDDILTYGLGLGYFAYMTSLKNDVNSITIVEKDKQVINLFKKYILPQFEYKDKIIIINEDAFKYEKENQKKYCLTFIDIWHDPSDGIELYLKFKKLEKNNTIYRYWIENTIKYYI